LTANPIITLNDIGKIYRVYNRHLDRVREALLPSSKPLHQKFHALSGISFTIGKGETVGIIGRNGSGKSTLLQIICGILQPTDGCCKVKGRISALLELGAGFNPEFSGRENVYLNGSILGLSKEEIDSCFADIESFAGIGDFIERPVKTYSSGMYVRLAFAVAINVKPDILIVDEALSVGDTLFQAKCFAKFKQFQEQGVTILFVTHSMDLVTKYCSRAFLLDHGQLLQTGAAKEVVDTYNRLLVEQVGKPAKKEVGDSPDKRTEDNSSEACETRLLKHMKSSEQEFQLNPDENRYGNGKASVDNVGIYNLAGKPRQILRHGERYLIAMQVSFSEIIENPIFAYTIKDVKGFDISGTNTFFHDIDTGTVKSGESFSITFEQKILLNAGPYLLSFGCAGFENGEYVVYDRRYDLITFEVVSDRPSVGIFDLDAQIVVSPLKRAG
jgi:teichoic acid transport system ATP-binding protein